VPKKLLPCGEIDAYGQKAIAELVDQQVRHIDIGKAHIGIGRVHRGKLEKSASASVAEHDLVREVRHILFGSETLVPGPDIVNREPRPENVRKIADENWLGVRGQAKAA
jgi:hypothetical protein